MPAKAGSIGPISDVLEEWRIQQNPVTLRLSNGDLVAGIIERYDEENLVVKGNNGKQYWIPKRSVIYVETP